MMSALWVSLFSLKSGGSSNINAANAWDWHCFHHGVVYAFELDWQPFRLMPSLAFLKLSWMSYVK
jgi:hypothetical protein